MKHQSSDLKNVLVVDDAQDVLDVIKSGLARFRNIFTILTAKNGREAIEILESQAIDLVVTDLVMPEVDGLELLAYMTIHFPLVPVIVLSNFGTQENIQKIDKFGVYVFMDKPVSLKKLSRFIIKGLKEASKSGYVTGISIPGFLQLIESEQKTCLLCVHGKNEQIGFLYFKEGELYNALFNDKQGENAALEIISWDYAQLSFRPLPQRPLNRNINTPIVQLLLESSRNKDETEYDRKTDNDPEETLYDDTVLNYLVANPVVNNQSKTKGGDQKKTQLQKNDNKELPITNSQPTNNKKRSNFMPGLKETLRDMANEMDGVLAIGIAGMDGITVAAHNPSGADMDAIAAKFAMLVKLATRSTMDLKGVGDFEENLIQNKNAWILTRLINKNYYLAVVVSREGTLGNVRLVVQKYASQFQSSLQS